MNETTMVKGWLFCSVRSLVMISCCLSQVSIVPCLTSSTFLFFGISSMVPLVSWFEMNQHMRVSRYFLHLELGQIDIIGSSFSLPLVSWTSHLVPWCGAKISPHPCPTTFVWAENPCGVKRGEASQRRDGNFAPPRLTRPSPLRPVRVFPAPQRWWGGDGVRF